MSLVNSSLPEMELLVTSAELFSSQSRHLGFNDMMHQGSACLVSKWFINPACCFTCIFFKVAHYGICLAGEKFRYHPAELHFPFSYLYK